VDRDKPLNARLSEAGRPGGLPRRSFLKMAAGVAAGGIFHGSLSAFAAQSIQMPFENGRRKLSRFPQKGEMIQLRERPPLLETPFEVFDQGVFTPNDQFFVRWHLPVIPNAIDVDSFRLRVDGHVRTPTEFTLKEILHRPDQVELAAVNQCSGNSRGFSSPRVPGGEWGNGAMGNALWTGITLKSLLDRVGMLPGAVQVRFRGLDSGEMPETPVFMKSLAIDHAMDGEVMVAYGMNGAQFPLVNGFPLRLIVPGWYSTYWVKMLSHIEVLDKPDENYWMHTAYLIPDTPGATMRRTRRASKWCRSTGWCRVHLSPTCATTRRCGAACLRKCAASPSAAIPGLRVLSFLLTAERAGRKRRWVKITDAIVFVAGTRASCPNGPAPTS
jgi:DMSO/TMAO reductase YedYZ molybdopterin-dependent catalytic subunit